VPAARRRTFGHGVEVVRSVAVRGHVVREADTRGELALEEVALVQEDDDVHVREQPVRHNATPEQDAVLESVHGGILRGREHAQSTQAQTGNLRQRLVERGYGCY
jgi:hypothetical protein